MKHGVIIILALCLLAASVVVGGTLLPATRAGIFARTCDARPDLVRLVIRDIDRRLLWRLNVATIEQAPGDTWIKVTTHGERIAFTLLRDKGAGIALRLESSRGCTGRWDATLTPDVAGRTVLTLEEQATTRSVSGPMQSRLFFDPEAFAATYLDEPAAEFARRNNEAA